jgi:hypothetical protein
VTEIFNPSTGVWTNTGNALAIREDGFATRLSDGRVLFGGGRYLASTDIFDPATGLWTSAGNMNVPRASAMATLLNDGTVLVAGGVADESCGLTCTPIYTDTAELFVP